MELNYIISITDRDQIQELATLFQNLELNMGLVMLGKGTATSEQLSIYGLTNTEKAIVSTVADAESTKRLIRGGQAQAVHGYPGQRHHAHHPHQKRRRRQDFGIPDRQQGPHRGRARHAV